MKRQLIKERETEWRDVERERERQRQKEREREAEKQRDRGDRKSEGEKGESITIDSHKKKRTEWKREDKERKKMRTRERHSESNEWNRDKKHSLLPCLSSVTFLNQIHTKI